MRYLPTDLQILNAIYDRYYQVFTNFSDENRTRGTKIYVPIDIPQIARDLKVDDDIVFGRLYYHLNQKHGYQQDDGAHVNFFTMRSGGDRHCVNFPLIASVLADLRAEHRKYRLATSMAIVSFVISIASFLISILRQ